MVGGGSEEEEIVICGEAQSSNSRDCPVRDILKCYNPVRTFVLTGLQGFPSGGLVHLWRKLSTAHRNDPTPWRFVLSDSSLTRVLILVRSRHHTDKDLRELLSLS